LLFFRAEIGRKIQEYEYPDRPDGCQRNQESLTAIGSGTMPQTFRRKFLGFHLNPSVQV